MTINSVSSGSNPTAHATTQPAKKPNVNFSDLMNAGMAAQAQATGQAGVTGVAPTSQTGKL